MTSHAGDYGDEPATGLGTDLDDPQPGSRVSLIPTTQLGPALGARLESWFASPGGLAVTAEVRVDPAAVDLLAGASVWANFLTASGAHLVLTALSRPAAGEDDLLELTGVAVLARETRRDAVRAGLRREVRLITGAVEHPATTLDLSSGGCRVQVADPEAFDVGEMVDVQLDLADEGPLAAAGEIVRSDSLAHEVAVRFVDLTESTEAALDALIYSTISKAR
jgi:hypothetical protein